MRGSRGVIPGTLVLMLACHATDASAQSCQKDNDCPGDLVCNAGQCQTLSGATPPAAATTPAEAVAGARAATDAAATATPTAASVTVRFEGEPALLQEPVTGQSCRTPCSMQLVPGSHSITMDGLRKHDILVPDQGGSMRVTQEDTGLIVGGAMLTAFGTVGAVVGLVFTIIGDTTEEDDPSTRYTDESETGGTDLGAIGLPLLLGGGAMLTGGVVMLANADQAALTPSSTTSMPMVGVVPVRGGFVVGGALRF